LKKHNLIILIAFLLELGLLTFIRGLPGTYFSPVLLLCTSIFIGLYPLVLSCRKKLIIAGDLRKRNWDKLNIILAISIYIAGIIVCTVFLNRLILSNPISVKQSDIIPTLEIMTKRLLNWQFPYRPIYDWGYNVYPSYLPLYWMPFLFSELTHLDYRWTPFIIWALAIFYYEFRLLRYKLPLFDYLLLSIFPFLVLLLFARYAPFSLLYSGELLVAGFYLVLALTIFTTSNTKRSIGLILTLLSRFSNILWFPFYATIIFFSESKKKAKIISIATVSAILLIYILPFISQNRFIFQKSQRSRTEAALIDWQPKDVYNNDINPVKLSTGVGVACYYYDFFPGSLLNKIHALQKHQLILSIISILILGIIYMIYQEYLDSKFFVLLALKIHFAFFYCFMQVPDIFLFFVPVFLSLVVLMEFFRRKHHGYDEQNDYF
jgi:hypothetical protein